MRILDVGPWIVYPPERGPAARAFTLLGQLSLRHDVRQFGRGAPSLRRPKRTLEEVPVTPMFRVYRYRAPLVSPATEWLLAREGATGLRSSLARHVACPPRLRELLEWANVVIAEDPLELALGRRERPQGRYVFVAHEIGLPSSVSSAGHDRLAEAVAAAELTIATSAADRDELITRYGLEPARVLAVPTAVDTELFTPADTEAKRRIRNELGLPAGRLAVFVGGPTPANRVGLSWIRRLADKDDGFTYAVVGGVGTPERRGNLIVTGRVRSIEPYLRAADVALCPVEHATGTRVKLLEALATGLPCVVFAESLHGTELENRVHVLVSGKSEQELLASLASLAADTALASGLGEAGRSFVADRHDAREAASILEDALLDLLDARPRAGA